MIPFRAGKFITIEGVEWMIEEGRMELRSDFVRVTRGVYTTAPSVIRVQLSLIAGMDQFGDKKDDINVVRRRFEKEG